MTTPDDHNIRTRDDVHIATWFPASEGVVNHVLEQAVTDEGRSDFIWLRLGNGDLVLGVFPRGGTYEYIEGMVEADYLAAEKALDLHALWDYE